MSLTAKSILSLFLALLLHFSVTSSIQNLLQSQGLLPGASIQDLLQSQGLPAGLFPNNVESYRFDFRTGRLEVFLESPCLTRFDSRVYFNNVVKANLSYGGLMGLEGVAQEELFLWLPVKRIIVDDPSSGLVMIDIGLALKQVSLSLFEDPPVCKPQGISPFVWF